MWLANPPPLQMGCSSNHQSGKKKKVLCLAVAELCLRARKCFRWQNCVALVAIARALNDKKAFLYSGNTFCWYIDIL